MNFTKSEADPCVYVFMDDDCTAYILVWVDDLILVASTDRFLISIKNSLNIRFDMKDLGPLSYFLGIGFSQDGDVIQMSQVKYLNHVLERFKMNDVRLRSTPCEQNMSTYDSEEIVTDPMYREAVGSLVYAIFLAQRKVIFCC